MADKVIRRQRTRAAGQKKATSVGRAKKSKATSAAVLVRPVPWRSVEEGYRGVGRITESRFVQGGFVGGGEQIHRRN